MQFKRPPLRTIAIVATAGLFILWEIPAARRIAGIVLTAITSFDFFYERMRDPSWIGWAFRMALNPPPGTALLVAIVGLVLIYWSTKPKVTRMSWPVLGMLISVISLAGFGVWYLVLNQSENQKGGKAGSEPSTISEEETAKITAPFRAQIDSLNAKLAQQSQPVVPIVLPGKPADPPPKPKPIYTPASLERRLTALEEIRAYLKGPITNIYQDGKLLDMIGNTELRNSSIRADVLVRKLDAYNDECVLALIGLDKVVTNTGYEDFKTMTDWSFQRIVIASRNYRNTVALFGEQMAAQAHIHHDVRGFGSVLSELENWIEQKYKIIADKRKEYETEQERLIREGSK